jgi:hypothetical protein
MALARMANIVGELTQAVVPGGFKISTRSLALCEVERALNRCRLRRHRCCMQLLNF